MNDMQQKVIGSKFMCKMSTVDVNICAQATKAIPVFGRKFMNKFMVAVTFFFMQNFKEMFILVGEWHDFTDINITSPGKGCMYRVMS